MNMRVMVFPNPVPYPEALTLQDKLVTQRQADEIQDTLLILEHSPVTPWVSEPSPRIFYSLLRPCDIGVSNCMKRPGVVM